MSKQQGWMDGFPGYQATICLMQVKPESGSDPARDWILTHAPQVSQWPIYIWVFHKNKTRTHLHNYYRAGSLHCAKYWGLLSHGPLLLWTCEHWGNLTMSHKLCGNC